jgi:hypothetical protein
LKMFLKWLTLHCARSLKEVTCLPEGSFRLQMVFTIFLPFAYTWKKMYFHPHFVASELFSLTSTLLLLIPRIAFFSFLKLKESFWLCEKRTLLPVNHKLFVIMLFY